PGQRHFARGSNLIKADKDGLNLSFLRYRISSDLIRSYPCEMVFQVQANLTRLSRSTAVSDPDRAVLGLDPVDHAVDPLSFERGAEAAVAGDAGGAVVFVLAPAVDEVGLADQRA